MKHKEYYVIDKYNLEEVVGETPYGRFLIDSCKKGEDRDFEADYYPGQYDYENWFEQHIGILTAYRRIHEGTSKEVMDTSEKDKLEIYKKVLEILREFEK